MPGPANRFQPGTGTLRRIVVPDPGPGLIWTYSPDPATRLSIISVFFRFSTSAVVTVRNVGIESGNPTVFFWRMPNVISQGAGITRYWTWGPNIPNLSPIAAQAFQSQALPAPTILRPDEFIRTRLDGGDGGDVFTDILITGEEWIEP